MDLVSLDKVAVPLTAKPWRENKLLADSSTESTETGTRCEFFGTGARGQGLFHGVPDADADFPFVSLRVLRGENPLCGLCALCGEG